MVCPKQCGLYVYDQSHQPDLRTTECTQCIFAVGQDDPLLLSHVCFLNAAVQDTFEQ